VLAALLLGIVLVGHAADHRDGPIFPNTAQNGRPDINDVYIFRSPADTPQTPNFGNTVITVTICPFPGVLTPISFDPRLTLNINIINVTGHLNPDMTFQVSFSPPGAAGPTFNQVATLRLMQGATTTTIAQYTYNGQQVIPPPAFANNITFPGDAIATGKFIVGDFDDPFFFDSQGFTNFVKDPTNPANPFPRPKPADPLHPKPTDAKNFFGPNGNTLAVTLEVPTTKLTTANPPLLGVWATSAINGTQVDRMGRPAINTTLIPPVPRNDTTRGERRTAFNQGAPATDVANFRADMIYVLTSPKWIFSSANDATRAAALVDSALGATIIGPNTGLLPDVLTVDLTKLFTDPTNGFPNGRRYRDDTVNISLQIILNNPNFSENVPEDNGTRITDGLEGSIIAFPYIGRPNIPPGGPNP
jgi:hypothetical protein